MTMTIVATFNKNVSSFSMYTEEEVAPSVAPSVSINNKIVTLVIPNSNDQRCTDDEDLAAPVQFVVNGEMIETTLTILGNT